MAPNVPHFLLFTLLCSLFSCCIRICRCGQQYKAKRMTLGYKKIVDSDLGTHFSLKSLFLGEVYCHVVGIPMERLTGWELKPVAHSHQETEVCQQPREWAWKQILLPQLHLQMAAAQPTAWVQHPGTLWPRTTHASCSWVCDPQNYKIINGCYFKLLKFQDNYFIALDNSNRYNILSLNKPLWEIWTSETEAPVPKDVSTRVFKPPCMFYNSGLQPFHLMENIN